MIRIENECVGCRDLGLPCRGSFCPNRHVVRIYCDICRDEICYDSNAYDESVEYHICERCAEEEEE